MIRKLKLEVRALCSFAKVSRSGYYQWLKQADEPEKDYEDYLLIKEIFEKGKQKYGFRTIQMKLSSEQQIIMNHKKITRIMNKYDLITKIRRKNPYKAIMKRSLEHRTLENKLDRAFAQPVPFRVFCTDITYLAFNHRFVYLSVIKDIASGEVMAWHLSRHLEMDLVFKTIEHLKQHPALPSLENVMLHSDQGFHYTNPLYISLLEKLSMVQSMSRKGNCIDNAPIESFFGHLKDDVDHQTCKTFEELHVLIENYVRYYNHQRQQWHRKKMTPVQYRDHLLQIAR